MELQGKVALVTGAGSGIGIVFANAGINGAWAPIDELQPNEQDGTIATNLRGTYLTVHYSVPHLKQAGGSAIIITASLNCTRTFTSPRCDGLFLHQGGAARDDPDAGPGACETSHPRECRLSRQGRDAIFR